MNNNTSKNNKYRLDIYKQPIYYIDLIVCKYPDYKKLSKLFDITEEECDVTGEAVTIFGIKNKKTNKNICLVLLSEKCMKDNKLDQINTCSHEALHYVIDLMSHIGQQCEPRSSEAYCYLQGWATECIYNTLIKK